MGADDDGVVRMATGKQVVPERLLDNPVRLVLAPLPPLVTHHILLVGERRLVEHVEQITHAIAVYPQAQLQLVRWQGVEVVGAIEVRRSIRIGNAGGFQQAVGHASWHVLGGGEHHVLEQVGESRAARLLIGGANVVPDVDRDQRQSPVFGKNDFEAVFQAVFFVVDARKIVGFRRRSGAGDYSAQQQQEQRDVF